MDLSRFRHVWKLFSHINKSEYTHIFKHGASKDTMLSYVNGYARKINFGGCPISKQEIRDVLRIAKEKGYVKEIFRYYKGNTLYEFSECIDGASNFIKIPSRWIFLKG